MKMLQNDPVIIGVQIAGLLYLFYEHHQDHPLISYSILISFLIIQGAKEPEARPLRHDHSYYKESFNSGAAPHEDDDDDDDDDNGDRNESGPDPDNITGQVKRASQKALSDAHLIDSEGNYHASLSDSFSKLHKVIHSLQSHVKSNSH
jgi:hypothetical protein